MLDIRVIREETEAVKAYLKARNSDFDVDKVLALDAEKKKLLAAVEELKAKRNAGSKEVGKIRAAGGDASAIQEEMKKLGAAFGLGMGNMEGTCGALVAAEMLLGLKRYEGKSLLKQARAVSEMFKLYTGATLCKDIKGRDTGKVLCSCEDCVRNAVTICESGLYEK